MCIYKCYRGGTYVVSDRHINRCYVVFDLVHYSGEFSLIPPNPKPSIHPYPSSFGLRSRGRFKFGRKIRGIDLDRCGRAIPPWPSRTGSLARVLIPARCPYPAHWSHIWSQLWPKPLISLMVYQIVYPSHAQSVSYCGANGGPSWLNCYFCGIYSYPYLTPSVTET